MGVQCVLGEKEPFSHIIENVKVPKHLYDSPEDSLGRNRIYRTPGSDRERADQYDFDVHQEQQFEPTSNNLVQEQTESPKSVRKHQIFEKPSPYHSHYGSNGMHSSFEK